MEKHIQIILLIISLFILTGCNNDTRKLIFKDDLIIDFKENDTYKINDDLIIKKDNIIVSNIEIIDSDYYYNTVKEINDKDSVIIIESGINNNLNYIKYKDNNNVFYISLINDYNLGIKLSSTLNEEETKNLFNRLIVTRSE